MLIVRNLIYWFILLLMTPVMFLLFLPASFFHHGANKVGRMWALMLMWMLKNIIGLKYRVIGRENIPAKPSIICSKHQSGWETLALQEIFPLHIYVAKKELFRIPIFGWGLKMTKAIGIDRSNSADAYQKLITEGMARKKEGLWIAIFPEGTRIAPGKKGRYRLGAARMAKMFAMDLVPVALNSGEFWPRNSFLKYPGEITVVIGQPIQHESGAEEELIKQCESWIENQQQQINGAGPCAL